MSLAYECDVCGQLFNDAPGTVRINGISVAVAGGKSMSWDAVDFCSTCSAKLLKLVRPALNDCPA